MNEPDDDSEGQPMEVQDDVDATVSVDHPFIFFVMDDTIPLIFGQVVNPQSN